MFKISRFNGLSFWCEQFYYCLGFDFLNKDGGNIYHHIHTYSHLTFITNCRKFKSNNWAATLNTWKNVKKYLSILRQVRISSVASFIFTALIHL